MHIQPGSQGAAAAAALQWTGGRGRGVQMCLQCEKLAFHYKCPKH